MKRMGSRSNSQTGMDKEGQTEITITNVPVDTSLRLNMDNLDK